MSYTANAHWYDEFGQAMHEVKSADGKKMVKTTLRQARKMILFPSVTTVLKMLPKPQLEKWKIEQPLKQAFKNRPLQMESEYMYVQRMIEAGFRQVDDAAEAGKLVHAAAERFMQGLPWDRGEMVYLPTPNQSFPMEVFIDPVEEFMRLQGIHGTGFEQATVNREFGYAGCADLPALRDGIPGVLDYKTRKTYPGKPIKPYDGEPMQISAYTGSLNMDRMSLGQPLWGCNLYISTTEPGRVEGVFYDTGHIRSEYKAFGHLCAVWQHFNNYSPLTD